MEEFRGNYQALIETRLAKDMMAREPEWTESIAVGSLGIVESIGQSVTHRQLEFSPFAENAWLLREVSPPLLSSTA